jgi:hypothetical protein
MYYLPAGWDEWNLQIRPSFFAFRQQPIYEKPVNNKHIKAAVRC